MSRVCQKCGGTVKMEDQFCTNCGMHLEKEPVYGAGHDHKMEILSVWDYLLMLILMAIPVVNIIVCILWIVSKNGSSNRRNFAKAWLILAVVSTLLSVILAFGMVEFLMLDHYVSPDYQFHHEGFLYDIPMEPNEI